MQMTLLDYFVWNGAATSSFVTPWMRFPDMHRRAELWVDTKLTDGANTVAIELQTSVDQTTNEAVTSGVTTGTTIGPDVTEISSKLGPWVRLQLSTSGTAAANTMLSVWLIPKND